MDLKDGIPEQFRGHFYMDALLNAFNEELNQLKEVFDELNTERWFDTSIGKQLDGIGDIVVMSRNTAWKHAGIPSIEMTDERYKLFLKWKALKNVSNCTFPQFCEACKLMYAPKYIYYWERKEYPATMFVQIGANIKDEQLEMMKNALLFIKPAGVALKVDVFALEFFGFKDTNETALGFSEGKMAKEVIY